LKNYLAQPASSTDTSTIMATDIYYILLALFMAAAAGLVGSFALMRKMTLASDAISHIALPGLGLAILYGINPFLGGATTLLLGVVIIWKVEKLSGINADAVIGVIFAIALAIGSLLTPEEAIVEALFGGMEKLAAQEFIVGFLAATLVIVFIIKMRHSLVLSLVSRDLAKTTGINADRLNFYFLVVFAITIILGLRYLGVLLMGSLIIIPAAAARNLAQNLSTMLVYSSVIACVSISAGLIGVSAALPIGPITIGAAGFFFFLTLFLKKVLPSK